MTGNGDSVFDGSRVFHLDKSIQAVEIDCSVPRFVQFIPTNLRGPKKKYILKITLKGISLL